MPEVNTLPTPRPTRITPLATASPLVGYVSGESDWAINTSPACHDEQQRQKNSLADLFTSLQCISIRTQAPLPLGKNVKLDP